MTAEAVSGARAAGPPSDKPRNIAEAAQAFEALLVGQMLKIVRESAEQGGLGESDGSTSSIMEMAEEQMSRQMTANGGLGLAKLITSQLGKRDQQLSDTVERNSSAGASKGPEAIGVTGR